MVGERGRDGRAAVGGIDWQSLFVPDKSVLEIVVRGSLVCVAAFAPLRVLKREAGTLSVTDLIVVVFLADARTRRAIRTPPSPTACCSWPSS